jgi:hypothetical protein
MNAVLFCLPVLLSCLLSGCLSDPKKLVTLTQDESPDTKGVARAGPGTGNIWTTEGNKVGCTKVQCTANAYRRLSLSRREQGIADQ